MGEVLTWGDNSDRISADDELGRVEVDLFGELAPLCFPNSRA